MTEINLTKGSYYIMTTAGKMIGPFGDPKKATKNLRDGEYLIAVATDKWIADHSDPIVADKIVIDFEQKLLTTDTDRVTLCDVTFNKGDNILATELLDNWKRLLAEGRKSSKSLEIVGIPPIQGRNITNEMSNL